MRRFAFAILACTSSAVFSAESAPTRAELLRDSVAKLIEMQEPGGQWPYEGVYRVGGQLPIGYRIGGTSLVAGTLMRAAPSDTKARGAVERGLAFILEHLDDPLMKPSTEDKYDVRVWGHCCALEFLCQARAANWGGGRSKDIDAWIKKLVATLIEEEIKGGGWNYANHRQSASFVTAPVAQALLIARSQNEAVPTDVLIRARQALEASRTAEGAFAYSGNGKRSSPGDKPAGSAARSAVCETTLILLGGGSIDRVESAINAFHEHWNELKKRHQQTGTHVAPFQIAPYYFYYGHRYAAQVIELLPEGMRAAERERLLKTVLKTRDGDGTWNDRVFPRSRNYGTAMVALILLADGVPLPPRMESKKAE